MKTKTITAPTSKDAFIQIKRRYGLKVSIIKREAVSRGEHSAVAITFALIEGGSETTESALAGAAGTARGKQRSFSLAVAAAALIVTTLVIVSQLTAPSETASTLLSRDEMLDRIELLINDFDVPAAYTLAMRAKVRFPDDPKLAKLWDEIVRPIGIATEPPGARVFRKRYLSPEDEWEYFGTTPIEEVQFPKGFSRVKFEKAGYETLTLMSSPGILNSTTIRLQQTGAPDADMVFAEGYNQMFRVRATKLEFNYGLVGDFLIDRYEVTNRQYYQFVKAGGYENPAYWKQPFIRNGREIPRREAMALFVDSTGMPGPSTWEASTYPEGMADHPVAGVSWYEAAAYAEFAGKELPTLFHWCYAASLYCAHLQFGFGNYESDGTVPVGTTPSVGEHGTYDLPGNVREWCWTAVGDERCLLGGAWNDHRYSLQTGQWNDPFDRSEYNGFRCIKDLCEDEEAKAKLRREVKPTPRRNVLAMKPVSDEKFEEYLDSFFAYDKTAPEPEVVGIDDTSEYWRREKVFINCAYSTERMAVYLFLPRNSTPPYQPIFFLPGRQALHIRESDQTTLGSYNDYFVKSGRAIVKPVFWGTFERGEFNRDENGELKKFTLDDSITVRDFYLNWAKDTSRTIDYLETRDDIDCSKISVVALSLGGGPGLITVAVEPRIRCFIILSSGINEYGLVRPEADNFNYVGHITVPTLLVAGSTDPTVPMEECQIPTMRLLGTPTEHKKHLVLEGGHAVYMLSKAKRECLAWLDKYLGPVNR